MERNPKGVWEIVRSDAEVLLKGAVVVTLAAGFFAIYMIGLQKIASVFGVSSDLFAMTATLAITASAMLALWVRSVIERTRHTTKEDE
jgi:hypothetical protein